MYLYGCVSLMAPECVVCVCVFFLFIPFYCKASYVCTNFIVIIGHIGHRTLFNKLLPSYVVSVSVCFIFPLQRRNFGNTPNQKDNDMKDYMWIKYDDEYIYIYIFSSIKNAINVNCLIDDPLLLCNNYSQGVIINI